MAIEAERQTSTFKRSLAELTSFPAQEKTDLIICTDVEGPLFTGDFIAEAMSTRVIPGISPLIAEPTYGDILYAKTWEWFNTVTLDRRKRKGFNSSISSISQEGEDTLFTMPLFLACGVDEAYLDVMTLKSGETPGSHELVKTLQASGALVVGITTAPQEPYRKLVSQTRILDPKLLIGSPFPLDELRRSLEESGLFETEMAIVRAYLQDCYEIIDENSGIQTDHDVPIRILSEKGLNLLIQRIEVFHNQQLGLTYELEGRKQQRNMMLTGRVIEASRVLGDRSKIAVAQSIANKYKSPAGTWVAIGDGLNDTLMLQRAPISFGVNGPDAARAASIGVVTNNMRNLLPMLELIQTYKGAIDIDKIIEYGKCLSSSNTLIHRGGRDVSEELLEEHRKMKRTIRTKRFTY